MALTCRRRPRGGHRAHPSLLPRALLPLLLLLCSLVAPATGTDSATECAASGTCEAAADAAAQATTVEAEAAAVTDTGGDTADAAEAATTAPVAASGVETATACDVEVAGADASRSPQPQPQSQSPPPVFAVSEPQRRAVADLRDALERLNNLSHPLSPHTAGGLFTADTPEAQRALCRGSAVRAVVVSVGGYCKQKGFGGNMWGVGEALKYALNSGRMLVFADREKWVYVDPRDCDSRSWGCYFEPVGSCSEADLFGDSGSAADGRQRKRVQLTAKSHHASERVVYWDNCRFRMYERELAEANPELKKLFQVPEQFAGPLSGGHHALNAGWFGAAIDYALRPKPAILQRIEEVKQRLGWNTRTRPTIGVHVRRGEKWTDCGKACARRDIDAYMQAAVQWRRDYGAEAAGGSGGFRDVYVATDGDTVMDELREAFPGFRYFFNEDQYRDDNGEFEYVLKTWKYAVKDYLHINRTDCMVNTLVDLLLLSECDAIIGTGMSNFSNMAYVLLMAKLGLPVSPPCTMAPPHARSMLGDGCVGPLQHAADGAGWQMIKGFV